MVAEKAKTGRKISTVSEKAKAVTSINDTTKIRHFL